MCHRRNDVSIVLIYLVIPIYKKEKHMYRFDKLSHVIWTQNIVIPVPLSL